MKGNADKKIYKFFLIFVFNIIIGAGNKIFDAKHSARSLHAIRYFKNNHQRVRVKNQKWFLYKKSRKNNQNIGNLEFEIKKQELVNLINENYNFLSTRGSIDELNERFKSEEKIRLGNAFLTIYNFLAHYVINKNNQNNLSLLNQSNLSAEPYCQPELKNILFPIVSEILQQNKIEPNYYQKIINEYFYCPWSLKIQIFSRENIFTILKNNHILARIDNIKFFFETNFFKINQEIFQQIQNNEYESIIKYFHSYCLGELAWNEVNDIVDIIYESLLPHINLNNDLISFILEKITDYLLNYDSFNVSALIAIYKVLLKKSQKMEFLYQKAVDMKQKLDEKKAKMESELVVRELMEFLYQKALDMKQKLDEKKAKMEEEEREIEAQRSISQIWEITSQFIIE